MSRCPLGDLGRDGDRHSLQSHLDRADMEQPHKEDLGEKMEPEEKVKYAEGQGYFRPQILIQMKKVRHTS